MMLKVENLQVYYGAIHALQGISFNLEKGEIVAIDWRKRRRKIHCTEYHLGYPPTS